MVRDDATSWPLGSGRPSLQRHMDFVIEQALPGAPDAIESVLLDAAFVEARASLPSLGDPELLESAIDGTTARQRTRFRFTGDLSSAVTAVIDADKLTWVDDATYDLVATRPSTGSSPTTTPTGSAAPTGRRSPPTVPTRDDRSTERSRSG